MSCAYRERSYRQVATGRREGTATSPTMSWNPISHHDPVGSSFEIPDHSPDTTVVHPIPRAVLEHILRDPATDQHRWHAVRALVMILHDCRRLPRLTDDDIRTVWQVLLPLLPTPGHPPATTDLPSVMFPSYIEIPGQDIRRLVWQLGSQSSLQCQQWMWETFRARFPADPDRPDPAVWWALCWGIPLWSLPGGIDAITAAFRSDAHATLIAINNWLHQEMENDDPTAREGIRTILTIGYRILTEVVGPIDQGSDRWVGWMTAVQHALRNDPTLLFTIPWMADAVFTACLTSSVELSGKALSVITATRLFDHSRFIPTMMAIWHHSQSRTLANRAGELFLTAQVQTFDPMILRTTIETMIQIITGHHPTLPYQPWVVTVMQHVLRSDIAAPVVTPAHLRALLTNELMAERIGDDVANERYPAAMIHALWKAIESMEKLPDPHVVRNIASAAWNYGYGEAILHWCTSDTLAGMRSSDRMAIIRPGIYIPSVASRVIALIDDIDQLSANRHILTAIGSYADPQRPIPTEVLPRVVMACRHMPESVSPAVLKAVWYTDPRVAIEIIESNILSNSSAVQDWTIWSLGDGWGRGYDSAISDLIVKVVQHRSADRYLDPTIGLVKALLDGVAVGDSSEIITTWESIIPFMKPRHLVKIANDLLYFRDVWNRGDPLTVMMLLYHLYSRSTRMTKTIQTKIITRILSMLQYGWGTGNDSGIGVFLDRMIADTIRCALPSDPSVLAQYARVLRCGWGHDTDSAIGTRLLTLMAWLDRTMERWYEHDIGSIFLQAMMRGGVKEKRVGMDDRGSDRGPCDRTVLTYARMVLARQIGRPDLAPSAL